MKPITREEKIMSGENLTPITRKELFLAKAAGQNIQTPTPITREEMFLSKIGGGGGSTLPTCSVKLSDNDYCGPYTVTYKTYENGIIVDKEVFVPNGGNVTILAIQGVEMHLTIANGGYSFSAVGIYDKTGAYIDVDKRQDEFGLYFSVPTLTECRIEIYG